MSWIIVSKYVYETLFKYKISEEDSIRQKEYYMLTGWGPAANWSAFCLLRPKNYHVLSGIEGLSLIRL